MDLPERGICGGAGCEGDEGTEGETMLKCALVGSKNCQKIF